MVVPRWRSWVGRIRTVAFSGLDVVAGSVRSCFIRVGSSSSGVAISLALCCQKSIGVSPWDHPSLSSPAPWM